MPEIKDPELTFRELLQARGSNPAGVPIQWLRYIRFHPQSYIMSGVLVLGVVIAAAAISKWLFLGAIVPAGVLAMALRTAHIAFHGATTNPAVVLSVKPFTVAVFADMSMGGDPVPAIRIMTVTNPYDEIAAGARIPAVCTYQMEPGNGTYWAKMHPMLVASATTDEAGLRQALSQIEPDEWKILDLGLRRIPKPYRPGMYFLKR